jgi:uncharacterized protein YggT (Ycf19 family)
MLLSLGMKKENLLLITLGIALFIITVLIIKKNIPEKKFDQTTTEVVSQPTEPTLVPSISKKRKLT